ncbi:LmbE family protein [Flavobacterium akiainvivens]|uniref:LmbE family protein n=1 Tax=Flavobacterium akiainvivens TaxID=1202724 RepID=A0A0M8MF81_9FLAO|nr:PIG-L family deacetylase [Flavobacterium akiainvivens]KOS05011.1 LmbE family protein [Flavobacterium akiainvivens]SFQ40393.1 GlcNAc-PI de-N-acetylase [Flavobacterium akiainvivens]
MHKSLLYALLLIFGVSHAQQPEKPTSAEIYHKIEKLNFLGSALYLAAHPDDENTRLISYLANTSLARTGYLSLTRGDGGQNLIGTELRELLGVIRTQELIEARKIDGGEQFFSRANDFGFSKMPNETLQIWDKEQVLQDMVWVIRNFQPDVIITRFDHRSPGTTHGHHTSSAMLAQEAFELAQDKNYEPNQLKYTTAWAPQRLFFNVSWWFFGGKENFEKADKSKYVNISTGSYYPLLGKSNQEIAALSRSRHKSQGFGSTGERGEDMEYLELIKGPDFKDRKNLNLFEGIDTSWNRVKGGKAIGDAVAAIMKNYDFKNPSASVPALIAVYNQVMALEDGYWKWQKTEELKEIIADCSGLYLEAVADVQSITPGSTLKVKWEAINRSGINITLSNISTQKMGISLKNNQGQSGEYDVKVPDNFAYTSPYWLMEPGTAGMYAVNDLKKIGIPDIIRNLNLLFTVDINGTTFGFPKQIVYKYNDPVDGEVYQPLDIIPAVTTRIANKVQLFTDDDSQTVSIKIKAGKDNCKGSLRFELPAGWEVTPASIPFDLKTKGSEVTVEFEVTAPDAPSEVTGRSIATMDGREYDLEQTIINYPHINIQQVLLPSTAKFTRANVRIKGKDIAYLMGAGDNVPASLEQMGYNVTLIGIGDLSAEKLKKFDAVVVGIRAYNVLDGLAYKQQTLLDYVHQGGTMVVQYNTTGALTTKNVGPYPFRISRDRVTEEDAQVTFIDPKHPVLNYPNKLTEADFKGWVQEQGLYYPDEWAPEYTPIISSHDKGEPDKKSAILVAKYGKGYYVYTGLSFFRELPEGVSGAYRLMANLIAIGQ